MTKRKMWLDFFPYGTQYYRFPTPRPEEWEKDLRKLAAIGYTHVQFRPQWRSHERIRGHYEWDDIDRLFELAERNRLRVVLKPLLECAPDWIFRDCGGTRIGFGGMPLPPIAHGAFYVGGWLPCFDHPEVMAAGAAFARAAAERYKGHAALWFYDAWNEPRSRPAGQCHCVHSVASYRHWLADRFGSIEALNQAFGKAWTGFDYVMPPESANDYAEMFLWRQWAAWAVAEQVRQVGEAIHRADPDRAVLNHIGGSSVQADSVFDSSDDLLNAAATDFYGCSFPVPLHPADPVEEDCSDLIGDWLRRVDPEFWIHEFYPSWGGWSRPCEPETLNRLLWQALASGTQGFTFWQYRSERVGNECNGFAMREINGDETPRSRICDKMAEMIRQRGGRLIGTRRPRSRVAQLYNKESDLISRIQACGKHFMSEEQPETANDFYKRMIAAGHALYDRLPDGVDFVVPADDFAGYEFLVLIGEEMVSEATARKLEAFVAAGGTLAVEYPFACREPNTWIFADRPGWGLERLTGFREQLRLTPAGETARLFGREFGSQRWIITGEVAGDAEVIGYWSTGEPAALRRKYGKGEVFTLAASPSYAYAGTFSAAAETVAAELLETRFPGELLPSGLSLKFRLGKDGRKIAFLFNLGRQKHTWPLPAMEVWDCGRCRLDGTAVEMEPGGFLVGEVEREAR